MSRPPRRWYDKVRHFEGIFKKVRSNWQNDEDVFAVTRSAGEIEGGDPHIIVEIEEESDNKQAARDRIPDKRDGVAIRKPVGGRARLTCDNYDWTDESPEVPGGLRCVIKNNGMEVGGTLAPMIRHDPLESTGPYWATAAHNIPGCGDDKNGADVYHPTNVGTLIGTVLRNYSGNGGPDLAIIEAIGDNVPHPDVARAYDTSVRDNIENTMSLNGVEYYQANNITCYKQGAATCETAGDINSIGQTQYFPTEYCYLYINSQIRWGTQSSVEPGDSGGVLYAPNVNDPGRYLVVCMNTGHVTYSDYSYGTAGYNIYNQYDYGWFGDGK